MDQSRAPEVDREELDDKRFLDANESDKTAILDGMTTVMDMQQILPEDLKTWDKKTTSQVLQKAFDLGGIQQTTEAKTREEVLTEQSKLQNTLTALKLKRSHNEALLNRHREVEARRAGLQEALDLEKANLNKGEELIRGIEQDGFFGRRIILHLLGLSVVQVRQKVADLQDSIDRLDLESPLRND